MNNGALTQEEIDALLHKGTDSISFPVEKLSELLTELDRDAMGEIGNISFGTAATALSTLLQQKVDITTPKVSVIRREDLSEDFPMPHVMVGVRYTEGFEGVNVLAIRLSDAQIIADLMLGGDGSGMSGDLNELHLSAVSECMNQMMGSAATSMSTLFNKVVNISPPSVNIVNLAEESAQREFFPTDEPLVSVSFRLIVGTLIDSHIMQLIPVAFAKGMIQSLMGPDKTEPSTTAAQQAYRVPQSAVTPTREFISAASEVAATVGYGSESASGRIGRYEDNVHTKTPVKPVEVHPAAFAQLDATRHTRTESKNLDLLLDIPLSVTVELGRTKRLIREVLELGHGSVIELDKLAGEPVDILVNNKLVARGEVVVIDDKFGVRVIDILSPSERIQKLQ